MSKIGKFCPISQATCVGRECALAIEINDIFSNRFATLWQCGLVKDHDTPGRHIIPYIDYEKRN